MPAVLLTTTAAGLVALLDRPSSGLASGSAGSADDVTANTAVAADSPGVAAGGQPPDVSSTQPAPGAPVVDTARPAPTVAPLVAGNGAVTTVVEPPTPETNPPVAASGCGSAQTLDGTTIDTKWGPVQVEVVVAADGRICDVTAIQSPDSHNKSVRINNRALPILHKQVMSAQGTHIDGVSGATITSWGYERSLQSILDGLGG
jgi:uncharacterized protein with FMN-binding domain